jgi:serine/threonine-protein kinase
MPLGVAAAVSVGALSGLGAAHDARDARGEPLHLVHRDVSPQNLMVGADGVTRIVDFGVAKARARVTTTQEGHLKGKIAYMAPEQLSGAISPQSDIYALGVVLWEMLAGRRLFSADSEVQLMALVERGPQHPPSDFRAEVPAELDRICARALSRDPSQRYESAVAMARDIDRSVDVASAMRVSEWMSDIAGEMIDARTKQVAEMESEQREVGSLEELSRTALEDAATKAVATVSSLANQVVADGRRMATKAARDVGALATANPLLKAALARVSKPPKKQPEPEEPEEKTRTAKRPRK